MNGPLALASTTVPIGISRVHFPVTALGPGQRLGIWFQGCSIRCPGCISADTWADSKRPTTVGEVLASLLPKLKEIDGFTISGGEPFDQPEALESLLRGLRSSTSADILVFSGHKLEDLGDRLAAVLRHYERALDLGTPGDALRRVLAGSGKVDSIVSAVARPLVEMATVRSPCRKLGGARKLPAR